jgi:DNA polymerase-1
LGDLNLTPFVFNRDCALDFVRTKIESPSLSSKIQKLFPMNLTGSPLAEGCREELFQAPHSVSPSLRGSGAERAEGELSSKTITTESELDAFLATVKNIIAIDTETTGLDSMTDKLVGISLATDSKFGVYIPLRHQTPTTDLFGDTSSQNSQISNQQLSLSLVREKLWPILINPNITKVGHNLKFDLHILANDGFDTDKIAPIDDTMLLSYILFGTRHGHGLDELAQIYLEHENITFASLFPPKTKNSDMRFDTLDIAAATPYAAEDAVITLSLYNLFRPQLDNDEKLRKLYENCDLPLVKILLNMERAGVLVDKSKLNHLSVIFHDQLTNLESDIWKLSGHEFNVASPKQLAVVLFDELNLPANKKRSTDADILNELSETHEIVDKIKEYRSIAKLAGTYADALPRQIGTDGRIHTTYLQGSTNTGRLSSRDPNLKNIPVKTTLGEEIRKCFVAPPGRVLLSLDYSQIQLRLLAHVADVRIFNETFANGLDIHEQTARKIWNIPDDAPVPSDLRRAAKTVNFSIIYGISSFGLAAQLNVSRTDAQKTIDSYMAGLPEIRDWMNKTRELAMANGCVYTPWGRRIEIMGAKNPRLRAYAMRAAINAPIQGFEADLMRRAMINIAAKIANNKSQITLIMQVHDEMIFECDESVAADWAKIIEHEMESVAELSVPINADFCIAPVWGK